MAPAERVLRSTGQGRRCEGEQDEQRQVHVARERCHTERAPREHRAAAGLRHQQGAHRYRDR